ncbi:asparagine synthase-related protein [Natronococcus occultus]|uniref:Asparagine synthase (Glutamine-hydrolyzing) n=1 Tax=Natronococcus occultus SP4 TaxID=694430 RepID=L0K1V1_9EURY|nr:asparagine synthase-related protein [Natronococcus occultus]AGB38535.1 asparagine synthase (glutamine-hydrolyzing) [Natronococcus occultus SP4]
MQTTLYHDGWTRAEGVAVRGRAFEDGRLLEDDVLAARLSEIRESDAPLEDVAALAATLEGFFAAVLEDGDATYLVADGARSIPLYYGVEGPVADRGRVVREALEAETDPVLESEFLLTRYVTGPETIWEGVYATQPGEVVRIDGDGIERRTYREYWPAGPEDERTNESATPRASLESALETALDRLERVAGDRPVVVPLSGGYDSRLLASALVERDREVIGFTFGCSGHPDVELSREIADRLGIRWEFCDYDADRWREWYRGAAGREYRRAAFGGDALPFLAEWPAVRELVADGRLPTDALYCPGHTVATPSERLPRFVGEREWEASSSVGCGPAVDADDDALDRELVDPTLEDVVDYVLDRHYALWEWDDPTFERAARERIRRGLRGDRDPDAVAGPASAAAAYERWEWRGRMATFTNGDLRVYEDAGLDWWLPLWDPAYVRAWERVPLASRRGKGLHADLARDRYRRAADVSDERAGLTDRSLSAADRHLALVRHSPVCQFTERGGAWEPPFLASRSAWSEPGSHPLAWYGIVDDDVLEALPAFRNLYALRTLAATGRLDLEDASGPIPDRPTLRLPTED